MRARVLVLFLSCFGASAAVAQVPELGLSIGLAPVGRDSRQTRETGLHGAFSLGLGTRSPGFGARADLAWEHLPGRDATANGQQLHRRDLNIRSMRGSLVYTFSGERIRPYALLGAGAYRMRIPEEQNPYGTVAGVHAGIGLRFSLGSVRLATEVLGVVPLSDYGSGRDFQPVSYFPLSLGVRF